MVKAGALQLDPAARTVEVGGTPVELTTREFALLEFFMRHPREVLSRTREHLEANERAEVARLVQRLMERSGLGPAEFASRIGVPSEQFTKYLSGATSPSASLMIRMRRLSDRFAKIRAQRADD